MKRNQAGYTDEKKKKGRGERKGKEVEKYVSFPEGEKNLKSHHLSSRQLFRKDQRIKNVKLYPTPKSTQHMI